MVFFGFDRLLLYLLRSRWLAPLPLFAPHAARPSVSVSSCCLLSVLFRTQCFSFQSIMYDVSLLLFICLCMSRLRIDVDVVYHNPQIVSPCLLPPCLLPMPLAPLPFVPASCPLASCPCLLPPCRLLCEGAKLNTKALGGQLAMNSDPHQSQRFKRGSHPMPPRRSAHPCRSTPSAARARCMPRPPALRPAEPP